MSGCYVGAQALIQENYPQAVFSPCSAHILNLCGVHAAESNDVVKTFFWNIQKLYNLFSSSPSRWKILQEIAQISLRIKSFQGDLKCIREAWHVILEESKLVAGALGINEQFQEKQQRIRKAFYDENRDNECEIQDNEAQQWRTLGGAKGGASPPNNIY